jgi:ring-1,2-phenylacetyl-CoA epoxidase subunit PaaC
VTAATATTQLGFVLGMADDNLILAQRLGEHISRAADLEEDLAVANIALDHLGVAQHLYTYAGELEGKGRTEDDFAFLRTEREFTNALLVEQPQRDFAELMARQLLFDAYQVELWLALVGATDERLAGIAAKALKEARYHLRHSSTWVIRLGDGTDESHRRTQAAIDALWRFTGELFEQDGADGVDTAVLRRAWDATIDSVLDEATLHRPDDPYQATGGRRGVHSEHLGHLLAEMQWLQRSYPDLQW